MDAPKPIADQGTTFSNLSISNTGTVSGVEVRNLNLAHSYASDLTVFLISPQGTRVELFSHRCSSNVWSSGNTGFTLKDSATAAMGATCPPGAGTYKPVGSLAAFVGQQVGGTWKLEVNDTGAYDTGTIQGWTLWVSYSDPTCPVTPNEHMGPVAQPTPVPNSRFEDVAPQNTFKAYVEWMAVRGYISGYACGAANEPCPGTYFRPGAYVTRGQLLKMVVNAAGWPLDNPKDVTFADVPRDSAFFTYVATAAQRGIINGYACGGTDEPCDVLNRPYFRPSSNITRGQLGKVLALALALQAPQRTVQTFADVPENSPFHGYIEAIASRHIVGGYLCGAADEPCDALGRAYYRPAASATRGQVAKFVATGYDSETP